MNIWKRRSRIPEIYGTMIALGLIVFFFIMYAVGLIHNIELRLLNLFILLAGVYYAMKQYRRTHDGSLNYFRALVVGTATGFVGVSTFALFLFIYLKIDIGLMETIRERQPLGVYLDPYMASFAVWLEGVFSGLTVTYLLVNYIDTDKVTEPT